MQSLRYSLVSCGKTSMKQFFILLLGGLLLVLIQAIPWNYIGPRVVQLNLSFVFVIFLALYHPSIGSWFLAFLLGYTLDTLSGTPAGLLPLINLIAFSFIRVARRIILFESLPSQTILVFALSFSSDLFLLTITKIVSSYTYGSILKDLMAHSFLLAALSVPLFAPFNKRVRYKGPVFK